MTFAAVANGLGNFLALNTAVDPMSRTNRHIFAVLELIAGIALQVVGWGGSLAFGAGLPVAITGTILTVHALGILYLNPHT